MKITAIRLKGLENIDLRIKDADPRDKYIMRSFDGLGLEDMNIAIANTASGGKYQGRTPVLPQPVFLISLQPDWWAGEDAQTLRTKLQHLLSTGYDPYVTIQLLGVRPPALTGPEVVLGQVRAYVSKFEKAIFQKDPAVQITFDCLDPTFRDPLTQLIPGSTLNLNHPVIENRGSAEVGFQMSIKFTDDMSQWFIKVAEHQSIGMTFKKDFNAGDVLSFSTIPGSRYVHWNKHRGKVQNKMGLLTNNSEWISLHPGLNHFVVPLANKWEFKGPVVYTPLYWGP